MSELWTKVLILVIVLVRLTTLCLRLPLQAETRSSCVTTLVCEPSNPRVCTVWWRTLVWLKLNLRTKADEGKLCSYCQRRVKQLSITNVIIRATFYAHVSDMELSCILRVGWPTRMQGSPAERRRLVELVINGLFWTSIGQHSGVMQRPEAVVHRHQFAEDLFVRHSLHGKESSLTQSRGSRERFQTRRRVKSTWCDILCNGWVLCKTNACEFVTVTRVDGSSVEPNQWLFS